MASINPFAKFLIQEIAEEIDAPTQAMKAKEAEDLEMEKVPSANSTTFDKVWELEESIFEKPAGTVKREYLYKTSAEMFTIYKYTNSPVMKVCSDKYTKGVFTEVKDILNQENSLLETSILNLYQVQ